MKLLIVNTARCDVPDLRKLLISESKLHNDA